MRPFAPLLLVLVACGRLGVESLAVGDASTDAELGRGSRGEPGDDGGVFDLDGFTPVPNADDDAAAPAGGGSFGSGGSSGAGGAVATGGTPGTGGMSATGGSPGTGGMSATGGAPGTGGVAATGGTPGTGGVAATGGTPGTGGVVATGGTPGTGGVVSAAPSAAIASYYGSWIGSARNASLTYPVEIAVVDRNPNEKLGLFHIPSFDCGGITTLSTLGTTLVYKETLLFDARSNCGPAGTTTLTPTGSGTLDYAFFDGKKTDRGSLARRAGYIGPSPTSWLNVSSLWSGSTTNLNPGGVQTVYVALFPTKVGNIGGHVVYPSKRCGGTLTLTGVNGQTLTYVEKLSHAIASCTDGNTVTATSNGAGLTYTWSAGTGASGSGTLSLFK
ncbi:MAG: hypothetical protein SF187_24820 [Deltaproteobacteria bacterium]|nr:hypothetical protein [Deltaproteobacteria bacterium]